MKGGIFVRIMLVLVFLALVANLVLFVVTGESKGSVKLLEHVIYFSIFAANLFLVGAGVFFTTASNRKHRRGYVEWARRGFVANGVIAVLFGISPWLFEEERFDAGVVLVALGISTIIFVYAAYRDFLRVRGTGSRTRRTPTLESVER
jgi:amino acid transporter